MQSMPEQPTRRPRTQGQHPEPPSKQEELKAGQRYKALPDGGRMVITDGFTNG